MAIQFMNRSVLLAILLVVIYAREQKYPDGLWPLNVGGNFSGSHERILSYFDFNRDRFVDMVTQSQDAVATLLNIYLWNNNEQKFQIQASVAISGLSILSVIPANFTHNDRIDLVVTFDQTDFSAKQTVIYSVQCSNDQCAIAGSTDQPQQHYNLPTIMQILGSNALVYSDGAELKAKVFNQGVWTESSFYQQYVQMTGEEPMCKSFGNIFYTDYSGDCRQDVIIHCLQEDQSGYIQFLKASGKKFVIQKNVQFVDGPEFLNLTVSDINFDGLMDILLLRRSAEDQLLIEIHYNIGIKSILAPCSIEKYNNKDQFFPFHFVAEESHINGNGILEIQRIPIGMTFQATSPFGGIIRTGDINNDGYSDLIVENGFNAKLFINQHCLGSDCGSYNPKFLATTAGVSNLRKFTYRALSGVESTAISFCSMSFFDLYEDGHLDMMGVTCDQTGVARTGKITPIINALQLDAFFMKITVLANPSNAKIKETTIDRKINVFGAHVDLFVTSLGGQRIPACASQLSNPGLSLQLPYAHLGLGRTNNYVEDLAVAISRKAGTEIEVWTPIVPNSQLIIAPGPSWVLLTYISPTEIMAVVFWFVVLILIVMGVVIMRLNQKEKQEDKENEESFYAILR